MFSIPLNVILMCAGYDHQREVEDHSGTTPWQNHSTINTGTKGQMGATAYKDIRAEKIARIRVPRYIQTQLNVGS